MKVGGSAGGEALKTAMPSPTPPRPSEQEACEVSARHCHPLCCPAPDQGNQGSTIFASVASVVLVQSIRLWSLNPFNLLLFLSSLGLQSKA